MAGLNPDGVERKDKVTSYVLTRHTYASQALMQSRDLQAVSDQLHHSDMRVTKKRYAKVSAEHKKAAIGQYANTIVRQMVE